MPTPDPDPPADALGRAREYLAAAVALGGPTLRGGDDRGAYELYACAGRLVLAAVADAPHAHAEIAAALDQTDLEPDPAVRAAVLDARFRQLAGEPVDAPADADSPLDRVHGYLTLAGVIGRPAAGLGHFRGCYEVYAATARMVLSTVTGADEALGRLRCTLAAAVATPDEQKRACLLRAGFDDVLAMGGRTKGPAIGRRETRLFLSMAMQIGTPAYNLGDHRGCYEVYAATARLLAQVAAEGPAEAMRDALRSAAVEPDVSEQAWILRRAFDRVVVGG